MEIPVRFSSGLARLAGNARLSVQMQQGATVSDLLDRLCLEYPSLSGKMTGTVIVIAGKTVDTSELLHAGQEVAVLTPISGG